jgi:hypothetical protein
MYTYEKPWRNTKMGAKTINIAVCTKCKKIIKPSRVEASKEGTHGTEYYIHDHPLVFVTLEQSNRGKRYISVPEELIQIQPELERAWVYEGATVNDIIRLISLYLSLQSS